MTTTTRRKTLRLSGELGGLTIKSAKTGWTISGWSRVTGDRTCYVDLVPYASHPDLCGRPLDDVINDYGLTVADYLRQSPARRPIRRGLIVR